MCFFFKLAQVKFAQNPSPSPLVMGIAALYYSGYTGLSLMLSLFWYRRIISCAILEFLARLISPFSLTVAVKRYSLPAKTSTILPLWSGAMIMSCFLSVWILIPPPSEISPSVFTAGWACCRSRSDRGLISIPMPILLTMAETFLPPLPIAAGTSLSSIYTTALVSLIISTSTAPSVYLPISRWISFSFSFQPGRSSDGARGVASGMDARELPGLLAGETGWPLFWDKGAFATGAAGAAGIPGSTGITMV